MYQNISNLVENRKSSKDSSKQTSAACDHVYTHKLAGTWGCRAAVCLHIHVAAYACTQNVVGGWIILEGALT